MRRQYRGFGLGTPFGASCVILSLILRILSVLTLVLAHLGHVLGPSWPHFGLSRGSWPSNNCIFPYVFAVFDIEPPSLQLPYVGPSWLYLGLSWGHLGAILGPLGAILGPLGASLGPLGTLLGFLGACLGPPGGLLGPPRGHLWAPWGFLGALMGILGPF